MKSKYGLYLVSCCCFALSLVITSCLSAGFFQLVNNAGLYSSSDPTLSYDRCGGIFEAPEPGADATETKWSQIYSYNAILYLILAVLNAMTCCCVPCAPAIGCGAICFFCSGIPTVTAIILTGFRLLNAAGSLCAENTTIYNEELQLSFADDALKLHKLWVA